MATATVRVTAVEIDPQLRDRFNRWLVTASVVTVHEGDLAGELQVLVHSPSRNLRSPRPVGELFRWTLPDDGESPYLGLLDSEPVSGP
jgi:hypothetical protein